MVGIWATSPGVVLGPFWVAVSLTRTWRVTVCLLTLAETVTRPPVVPEGVNTPICDGPAGMVPMLPLSTPHETAVAPQLTVAL